MCLSKRGVRCGTTGDAFRNDTAQIPYGHIARNVVHAIEDGMIDAPTQWTESLMVPSVQFTREFCG